MSDPYAVGDRVATTVDAPTAWDGGHSAPAGTLGTITHAHQSGGYGVLLDGCPDQTPAYYRAGELRAAGGDAR